MKQVGVEKEKRVRSFELTKEEERRVFFCQYSGWEIDYTVVFPVLK